MHAVFVLVIYLMPFLVLGVIVKRWMDRKGIGIADVHAEGDPNRKSPRFLLGFWSR